MGVAPGPDREPPDAAVIAQSLAQPQSFGVIFDRHFDAVHGYLARRLAGGRADDLASTTFIVAFERRRTFRSSAGSARPWLFGIATNLLRNEWRAQERDRQAVVELSARGTAALEEGGAPDPELEGSEPPLAELLAELDPAQRDILVLHAWEGFSYREIAEALGIPVGTVRSRMARARARLRAVLAATPGGAESTSDAQEVRE